MLGSLAERSREMMRPVYGAVVGLVRFLPEPHSRCRMVLMESSSKASSARCGDGHRRWPKPERGRCVAGADRGPPYVVAQQRQRYATGTVKDRERESNFNENASGFHYDIQ